MDKRVIQRAPPRANERQTLHIRRSPAVNPLITYTGTALAMTPLSLARSPAR
jgi:hypothetical protein